MRWSTTPDGKDNPMTHTDIAPDPATGEDGSDARLSPAAIIALQQHAQALEDALAAEELRTAEIDEADDEPDEPDELEDDARP